MHETFKAKSKNYKVLIDRGEEVFSQGGKQVIRTPVIIRFQNFQYTSRPEGDLSEDEVCDRLHKNQRYMVDFVSVGDDATKRRRGDYQDRDDLEPCEFCGRKEFRSSSSRGVHVAACEKKYKKADLDSMSSELPPQTE